MPRQSLFLYAVVWALLVDRLGHNRNVKVTRPRRIAIPMTGAVRRSKNVMLARSTTMKAAAPAFIPQKIGLSEREPQGDPESSEEEEAHLDAARPRRRGRLGAVPVLDQAHAEQQEEPNDLRRHVATDDVHRVELLARRERELRIHTER